MKAIAVGSLVRRAGLFLGLATCATGAEAQNCQALLNQILSGGSNVEWAMAASQEYNSKCQGGQTVQPPRNQEPRFTPPTFNPQQNAAPYNPPRNAAPYNPPRNAAPTQNSTPNTALQELAALSQMLVMTQPPLPQGIPLSNGTVRQEAPVVQQMASPDYVDPFAQRTPLSGSAPTSDPVRSYGSIWDPSQSVGLSPPAAPSATPQQQSPKPGPCGLYGEVCNAPITGFDRPAVVTPLPQSR
jgi:hypothetical protein